jgi:Fibronectin type III domain
LKYLRLLAASVTALALLAGCSDDNSGISSSSASTSSTTGGTGAPTPTGNSATLSWSAPTTNTNGTPLTDLSGYRIYYGANSQHLSQTVDLNSAGITSYVINNLSAGTWYFAISAVTANGVESALSDVASLNIS